MHTILRYMCEKDIIAPWDNATREISGELGTLDLHLELWSLSVLHLYTEINQDFHFWKLKIKNQVLKDVRSWTPWKSRLCVRKSLKKENICKSPLTIWPFQASHDKFPVRGVYCKVALPLEENICQSDRVLNWTVRLLNHAYTTTMCKRNKHWHIEISNKLWNKTPFAITI